MDHSSPTTPESDPTGTADVRPYDAVLLLSFGGPERPEDVVPFLENVTAGRGIPRDRLEQVGEHYYGFGGRSPINDQNRALLAALRTEFVTRGIDVPLYWGNRNWDPYLTDVLRQMAADGINRAAVLTTSAYSSYSSCRQYRENLADAVAEVPDAPRLDRLRQYFNHPGFVDANADAVLAALGALPEAERAGARLVFVTHSIPEQMAQASGDPAAPRAYERQHRSLVEELTARVAERTGVTHEADLVYCSRSGSPHVLWLEPDVNDHLEALHEQGTTAVVLAPIGFVSDHMEVVYDLDTEALATAQRLGLAATRAGTAGVAPAFVAGLVDLVLERAATERGEAPERPAVGSEPAWPDLCPANCCANARGDRPALCGQ